MAFRNAVGIVGCGWLGTPLAAQLATKGYRIHIATRSEDKAKKFAQLGYKTYVINWEDEAQAIVNLQSFASNINTLVFSIPPAWKDEQSALLTYIHLTQQALANSRVKNVLYLSSIGVYGAATGVIHENTPPIIQDAKTQLLVDAERKWINFGINNTTIARLGGLIGADRHPVFSLVNQSEIKHPNSSINLIHQEDAVGLLTTIIEHKIWGSTYNLVTPYHPSRREYYTEKAQLFGLKTPHFSHSMGPNRIVSIDKLLNIVSYRIKYPML